MKKILLIILLIICPPAIAYNQHISASGYNYQQGVVVNWDSIENLKSQKNIQKTIIIDSFSTKKYEKTNSYVVYQPNYKVNYTSLPSSSYMYEDKKKDIVKKEIQKKPVSKKVEEKQPVELSKINPIPTENVVIKQPRFIEEKKEIKKNLIATIKDIVPIDLTPKNKQIKKENNLENQYAVNNPFEDEFDASPDIENFIVPKEKKKKAPSYNPLVRFPLSDYTVKGLVTSDQGNRALITTAQGDYFYVKEGELIGINKGIIKEIKSNSIVILERDRKIEIIVSSNGRVSNR